MNMSDQTGRRIIIGTWVMAFGIIIWSGFSLGTNFGTTQTPVKGFPPPSRLVKTSLVWSLLAVLSEASAPFAAVFSVGMLAGLAIITFSGTPYMPKPASNANAGANPPIGNFTTAAGNLSSLGSTTFLA